MGLVVVIIVSARFAVPVWNSAAAPDAVIAMALGELVVVGAAFIVKLVPLVTEATVALLASPVPDRDIPLTSPVVRSHVTKTEPEVVTQLVKTAPHAVRESPVPVACAACESRKRVPLVIELTVVFPSVPPVRLPGMLGPVTYMPGHKAAVLAQVTAALPLVVAQEVRLIGVVLFEVPMDCRMEPPPTVVQELSAPEPLQLLPEVMLKLSWNTLVTTGMLV